MPILLNLHLNIKNNIFGGEIFSNVKSTVCDAGPWCGLGMYTIYYSHGNKHQINFQFHADGQPQSFSSVFCATIHNNS